MINKKGYSTFSFIREHLPIFLIGLVFASSVGMLLSSTTYARMEGGEYNAKNQALSYRDDYCYSRLAVMGEKSKQFGAIAGNIPGVGDMSGFSQGLVNAVVKIPIYDWDQTVPQQPIFGTLNTTNMTIPYQGKGAFAPKLARSDAVINDVRPIGYVEAFKFRVTPVPNIRWMADYATTQLPYDIGMLSMIVTGHNPVPMPSEAVANPLMYQRLAVINSYGMPSNVAGARVPDAYKQNPSEAAAPVDWSSADAEMPASEKQRLQAQYEQEIRSQNEANGIEMTDVQIRQLAGDKVLKAEEEYILQKQREKAELYNQYGQSFASDEDRAKLEALKADYERQAAPLRVRAAAREWVLWPVISRPTADAKRAQAELDRLTKNYENEARAISASVAQDQDKHSSFEGQRPNFMSALNSGSNALANGLVNTIVGLSSHLYTTGEYTVNKAQSLDNCYENYEASQTGGQNKVASYAFIVPDVGVPITFPGLVYKGIALLMGKNWHPAPMPSMSGVTFYVGGSMNGKDMLDCYGRGKQGTIMPSNVTLGNNNTDRIFWIVPVSVAARVAEAALTASIGLPPGTITNLPSPKFLAEKYHNGLSFGFSVNPTSLAVPDQFKNREIDFDNSVLQSIDLANLFTDSMWHEDSQNGRVMTPNLFIKLKKPYTVTPIPAEGQEHPRPDGTTNIEVPIKVRKTGFSAGTNKTTNPYRNNVGAGGKTYSGDRNFTNARIIKMQLEPGVSGTETIRKDPYFGHNNPDLIDGFADSNGSGICNYLEGKLKSQEPDGRLVNCEKVEDRPVRMEDGQGELELMRHTINIPAETPPGTKFCYAIYLDTYDNDMKFKPDVDDATAERTGNNFWYSKTWNWNSSYSAKRDKRLLSKVDCVISGYKPSLQVRAGDMIAGGNVSTETNRKDDLGSGTTPLEKRTFGSWAEYGLFAGGEIAGGKMASGAKYRVGQHILPNAMDPDGHLTFSNRYVASAPGYGNFKEDSEKMHDGFDHVTAFFDNRTAAAKPIESESGSCFDGGADSTIHLRDCPTGDYKLTAGSKYTIDGDGFNAQNNKSLVFIVGDNVTIEFANNIETKPDYETMTDISQVVFTPEKAGATSANYLMNIKSDVRRIDAWLINPEGSINTCFYNGGGNDTPVAMISPTEAHPCYTNELLVNGPVAAKHLFLRRSGGQDQNPAGTTRYQSVAGETFNLRPDAYLWAMNQPGKAHEKFTTVDVKDLPPRL